MLLEPLAGGLVVCNTGKGTGDDMLRQAPAGVSYRQELRSLTKAAMGAGSEAAINRR